MFVQVFSLTVLSALALNRVVTQETIEELVSSRSEFNDSDVTLAEVKTKKEMQAFRYET